MDLFLQLGILQYHIRRRIRNFLDLLFQLTDMDLNRILFQGNTLIFLSDLIQFVLMSGQFSFPQA